MTSGDEIRFKLVLHYDGSRFYGWQIQPEQRTVQGELQAAVEQLTQSPRTVTGAGRTDRGVHATGQVASVRIPDGWSADDLRTSLNAVLPDDIWVQEVLEVGEGFHPRYDAVARTYVYRLGLAPESSSPFRRPFCWPLAEELGPNGLDRGLLERCAQRIPGDRSYGAFAKSGQPQRGTRCRVSRAAWSAWDDVGLCFTITANRYLHHMVRYLVGTMVEVARGRRAPGELDALLDDPDTDLWTSPPAPPQGLYLHHIEYPDASLRRGSTEREQISTAPESRA